MSAISISGFDAIEQMAREIGKTADEIDRALLQTVNKTLDRGRTRAQRQIERDIAFPSGYLAPSSGRLAVKQRATKANLEGRIVARDRPTSLARFGRGRKSGGQGVIVEVRKGRTERLNRAFYVNLKNGNQGLAVRTGPGQRLRGSSAARQLAPGLFLLYGPSVDQALLQLRDQPRPGDNLTASLADGMADEFLRLIRL